MRKFTRNDTYEFLPSAQEIIDKPPTPLGGAIIYIIVLMFIVLFILSFVFKIDTLITTQGTVEVADGIQIVNTNGMSKITKINKKEGDNVKKGEVILQLEDDNAFAIRELQTDIQIAKLKQQMLESEIDQQRDDTIFQKNTELDNRKQNALQMEYDMYWKEQANDERAYQEKLQAIQEKGNAKDVSEEEKVSIQNAYDDAKADQQDKEAKKQLDLLTQLNNGDDKLREDEDKLTKLQKAKSEHTIRAPTTGTILTANYHTVGSYINPSLSIAEIVPQNNTFIIKTQIPNQDISKIKVGQPVVIKVEAYDYQVYGGLNGKVKAISASSKLNAAKTSLEYEAQIAIEGYNKNIVLKPGMTVSLDIKTNRKKVIDYILDPVKKTVDDAF